MIVLDRANGACCPELTTMQEARGGGVGQFLITLQAEVIRLYPRMIWPDQGFHSRWFVEFSK